MVNQTTTPRPVSPGFLSTIQGLNEGSLQVAFDCLAACADAACAESRDCADQLACLWAIEAEFERRNKGVA